MFRAEAKTKIEEELSRGEAARREGFEGRARVCARRAAGAAIREFLELRGMPLPGPSAVDMLAYLQEQVDRGGIFEQESYQIRQVTGHLLARVDESFSLPEDMDLLVEARWLARTLEALV